jgi:RNA recognition motif-containing protein
MDFEVYKCNALPELLDSDKPMQSGGYGGDRGRGNFGRNDFGGARNGGSNFGRGGGQSRGGPRNKDASVFVGNLAYTVSDHELQSMFEKQGLRPMSVRLLKDDQGRSKGSAFVDFNSSDDANQACSFNGKVLDGGRRPLRINPANRN